MSLCKRMALRPSFLCALGFTGGAVCDRIMQMIRIKDRFIGDEIMELKKIQYSLTVCKVEDISEIDTASDFYFIGKTDEELSLVCKTEDTPTNTVERALRVLASEGYTVV